MTYAGWGRPRVRMSWMMTREDHASAMSAGANTDSTVRGGPRPGRRPGPSHVHREKQSRNRGREHRIVASSINRLWISGRPTKTMAAETNTPKSVTIDVDAM